MLPLFQIRRGKFQPLKALSITIQHLRSLGCLHNLISVPYHESLPLAVRCYGVRHGVGVELTEWFFISIHFWCIWIWQAVEPMTLATLWVPTSLLRTEREGNVLSVILYRGWPEDWQFNRYCWESNFLWLITGKTFVSTCRWSKFFIRWLPSEQHFGSSGVDSKMWW